MSFKFTHGLIPLFIDSFNNLVAVTSQVGRYKGENTQSLGRGDASGMGARRGHIGAAGGLQRQ